MASKVVGRSRWKVELRAPRLGWRATRSRTGSNLVCCGQGGLRNGGRKGKFTLGCLLYVRELEEVEGPGANPKHASRCMAEDHGGSIIHIK